MASKKIDDLKKRANKRRMLEAQMKGLREEGKHWSGYIKKNERKAKATKAIKTAAEIAELAGGAGAVVKSVGKQVAKKASRVAMNKGSKFAKRSTRATQAQTAKKVVSKKGTTRGKATAKDILGGNPVRKKAVSKAAPKTGGVARKVKLKKFPSDTYKKTGKMTESDYNKMFSASERKRAKALEASKIRSEARKGRKKKK